MGDEIEQLYNYSAKLDEAEPKGEISQHEETYRNILKSAKGGVNAKKLSAQLIPKYLKHFPQTTGEAIDALTDLCEEEDVGIRVLGVRAFPVICKDNGSVVPKAAYLLGQLLQSENHVELDNVKSCLLSIFRISGKDTLGALFNQIQSKEEKQKTRALQFLKDKFAVLRDESLNKDSELASFFIENVKNSLNDLTVEEFKTMASQLGSLKFFKKEDAQILFDSIVSKLDLSTFKPSDSANVDQIVLSMQMVVPLLKKDVLNTKLVRFFVERVLPVFSEIPEDKQLPILSAVCEMAPFSTEDAKAMMSPIYDLFKKYISDSSEDSSQPNFEKAECLLFFIHQVGSKAPNKVKAVCGLNVKTIFTGQPSDFTDVVEASAEKREDFLKRLRSLESKNEVKMKEVSEALKTDSDKKDQQKKELKGRENISTMVKNLMKDPPVFQSNISLSWQPSKTGKRKETNSNLVSLGDKRPRGVYVPPRGSNPPKRGSNQQRRGGGQAKRGGRGAPRGRGRRGGRF